MATTSASRSHAMCMKIGDDEPGLQQHEQDDQEPAQIALKVEIIDEIGAGAQNEEQPPDQKIELDRMLLAMRLRRGLRRLGAACSWLRGRHRPSVAVPCSFPLADDVTTDRRMRR